MSKSVSENGLHESAHASELTEVTPTYETLSTSESPEQPLVQARLLGQPEGPFGTAAVSTNTVLLRSLGAARFTRFETEEIAPHGLFIKVPRLEQQPFQAKATLLEFHLFLDEPQSPAARMLKGIGRIEEVRSAVQVPVSSPSGYIFRILQLGGEDLAKLEVYIHELLLKAAM